MKNPLKLETQPYTVGPYPPIRATDKHPYVDYENFPDAPLEQLQAVEKLQISLKGAALAWPIFPCDLHSWTGVKGKGFAQFLALTKQEGWQLRFTLDPRIDASWCINHPQALEALKEIIQEVWVLQMPLCEQPFNPKFINLYKELAQLGRIILRLSDLSPQVIDQVNDIKGLFGLKLQLNHLDMDDCNSAAGGKNVIKTIQAPVVLLTTVPSNCLMRLELEKSYRALVRAKAASNFEKTLIVASANLMYLPMSAHSQEEIDFPAVTWVSFAQEKIHETQILATAMTEGKSAVVAAFSAQAIARASREASGINLARFQEICGIKENFSYPSFFTALRAITDENIARNEPIV